MRLRWEKEKVTGELFVWVAYSHELVFGHAIQRNDGSWHYTVDAVHMKWIGKGYGDVSSLASAKRAVERAWEQWLITAGLMSKPKPPLVEEIDLWNYAQMGP